MIPFVIILIIFYGVLFLLLCKRYRLSVDLTDESYYLSSIYSYYRGDIPISTIWDGHPGFILFAPLLFVYNGITGGFNGAMLFIRFSYLAFFVACAIVIYFFIQKEIGKLYGFLSVIPVIFVTPFSVANISYNTIGNVLVLLGSFLMFFAFLYEGMKKKRLLIFAGITYALAAFNYPTLVILCLINVILLYLVRKSYSGRREALFDVLRYAAGGIGTAVVILTWILLNSGIDPFINGIKGIINSPYKNTHRVIGISFIRDVFIYPFVGYLKGKYFLLTLVSLICAIILLYAIKKTKAKVWTSSLSISAFFFLAIMVFIKADLFSVYLFLYFHTIILLIFIPNKKFRISIVATLILPSMIAVINYSLSSNNNNVICGMFFASPIIITYLYCVNKFTKQNFDENKVYGWGNMVASIILSIAITSIFLSDFYHYVYRDEDVNQLNFKIESGIYKGIYTTEERKNGLENLEKTIKEHSDSEKTLLVANHFPGAYIMAGMKPFSPTIFEPLLMDYGFTSVKPLTNYYEARSNIPDMIFIILYEGVLDFYKNNEYEINDFINDNYELTFQDEDAYYPIFIYERNN